MARLDSYGAEVGRRRHDDSSSSRESSPQRRQKRSFSPPSDEEGDTAAQPVADDDTPQPPERPIIRQAVAFSNTPAPVNTYQASLTPTIFSSKAFLPGQVVPPPTGPVGTESRKGNNASKRGKRTDKFSAQTSRFRLDAYDPVPTVDPPVHQGTGPYTSLFRGATPTTNGDRDHREEYQAPTSSSGRRPNPDATSSSATRKSAAASKGSRPSNAKKQVAVRREKPASSSRSRAPLFASTSGSLFSATISGSGQDDVTMDVQSSPSYYRRNYENSSYVNDHQTQPAGSSSESRHMNPPKDRPTVTNERIDPDQSKPRHPIRLVTVLIRDVRFGAADFQLAEVKLSIRQADDPQDGYWADAKDLSEKLQASPSRIDGPAKVSTLRGRYRQYFLRVTADNLDEYQSANIVVSPDRTVDVIVEAIPPPGQLPYPPNLSTGPDELPSDPEDVSRRDRMSRSDSSSSRGITKHRHKRTFSPSFDDYDQVDYHSHGPTSPSTHSTSTNASRRTSPSPFSRHTSHVGRAPRHKKPNTGRDSISERHATSFAAKAAAYLSSVNEATRDSESQISDDDPDKLHELISGAVDSLLQKDPEWKEFFRAKATPPGVQALLKQYSFAQRMIDSHVGNIVSIRSHDHAVETSHILNALRIDDERFASACSETLHLYDLYGKNGSRYEDERVMEMFNDKTSPAYNAKPIKRFLQLLKEVDQHWLDSHSQDGHSGSGAPTRRSSSDSRPVSDPVVSPK